MLPSNDLIMLDRPSLWDFFSTIFLSYEIRFYCKPFTMPSACLTFLADAALNCSKSSSSFWILLNMNRLFSSRVLRTSRKSYLVKGNGC